MKQLSKIFFILIATITLILTADFSVKAATDSAITKAGDELRAGMVKRQPDITVVIDNGKSWNENELCDSVFSEALKETENGNEGDYLYYDLKTSSHNIFVTGTTYTITYSFTYLTTQKQESQMQDAIDELISYLELTEASSDLDKIRTIFEWLVLNVTYNWNEIFEDNDTIYTAYGALIEKDAVCNGYSMLMYRLLKEVGINNRIITGNAAEGVGHVWNAVELDGLYYHCDSSSESCNGEIYKYFLKGSEDFEGYDCHEHFLSKLNFAKTGYPVEVIEKTSPEGLIYQVAGHEAIINGYSGSNPEVIVPTKIGNYPVKRISRLAFSYNDTISKLVFSEGIEQISQEAVYSCSNLESIHYPSTVKFLLNENPNILSFATNIPEYCPKVKSVTVAADHPSVTVYDGALYSKDLKTLFYIPAGNTRKEITLPEGLTRINNLACTSNKYLKKITIPDSVYYIGYWAFHRSTALKELNIPDKCEVIGQYAFSDTKITSIHIPEMTHTILSGAFYDMPQLKEITVDKNNANYYIEKGALIGPSEVLLAYPAQRANTSISIPKQVTSIDIGAFMHAIHLEEVSLNHGLEYIGIHAFWKCDSIRQIEIPATVTTIDEGAFWSSISNKGIGSIIIPANVTSINNICFNTTVIYGKPGSAAETFARQNGSYFIDINNPVLKGTCGPNLTWSFDMDGLLKIDGIGEMYDYELHNGPWFQIRKAIYNIDVSGGVTSIGAYAFNEFHNLIEAKIPASVEYISRWTFEGTYDHTISGYANSYAQEFAALNNIDFQTLKCNEHQLKEMPYLESTCEENGHNSGTLCMLCGKVIEGLEVIEASGHSYNDNTCKICGATKPETEIRFINKSKAASYTGNVIALSEEDVEVTGKTGSIVFRYYIDSRCEYPVNLYEDTEGKAQFEVGVYYVTASVIINGNTVATTQTPFKLTIRPRKPTSFTVSNQPSSIKLSWKERPEAEGYIIYRKTGSSSYKEIKRVADNGAETLSFVDKNISVGKKYYYDIAAYAVSENGISVQSLKQTNKKAIVRTKLTSITNQNGSVKLKWEKIKDANGYKIYRKTEEQSKYYLIKTIKNTSTVSYTDKSKKAIFDGRMSFYYVAPYYNNDPNVITKSNVKTHFYLDRPAIKSLTAGSKAFTVKWDKMMNIKGYQIRYSLSSSFDDSTTVKVTSWKTVSKKISKLKSGKTYYVKIRTYRTNEGTTYYSAWSKSKKVKVK